MHAPHATGAGGGEDKLISAHSLGEYGGAKCHPQTRTTGAG